MNRCPSCGHPNESDGNFCERCGAPLRAPQPDAAQVVVGSSLECDVVLSSPIVSGQHVAFQDRGGGRLLLTDLGSTNGTWVNGQRVQIADLGPADRVSLGSLWLDLDTVRAALRRREERRRRLVRAEPAPPVPSVRPLPRHDPAPVLPVHVPPAPVNIHIGGPGPYGMSPAPGKIREPILVLLFGLLTFGLYFFYWFWVTLDEIRVWRQGQGWSGAMILLLFVPLANVVVLAIYFLIPSYIFDLYQRHGMPSPISGPFGLIIFVPALLVPLGVFATVASGGVLGLPVLVLSVLIPALCGAIWFWRCQSALNGFWRSRMGG